MCLAPCTESCLVDVCCYCFSLRVGTLILGYFYLIEDIIATVALGSFLAGNDWMKLQYFLGSSPDVLVVEITVAFIVINFLFTISLLVGVHREIPECIRVYLVFYMICIIVMILGYIASFFLSITAAEAVEGIIAIPLQLYFWVVIKSYHFKMGQVDNYLSKYTSDSSNDVM